MAGDLNLPKPEFDIEATVEKAMALLNRTLAPGLDDAQKAVTKVRRGKPLAKPERLIADLTRRNRINAARAVSYALPSIIPGYGTAISAAAIPPALREVLKEAVSATIRIGVLYERDLSDPELARAAVLLVLSRSAAALDVTKKVKPADLLGEQGTLLEGPNAFNRLVGLSEAERDKITESQQAILQAWAIAVGPPLLAGLIPFGVGPMAAANYIQFVMRRSIKDAGAFFGAAEEEAIIVPDVPDEDIQGNGDLS